MIWWWSERAKRKTQKKQTKKKKNCRLVERDLLEGGVERHRRLGLRTPQGTCTNDETRSFMAALPFCALYVRDRRFALQANPRQ